MTTFVRRALTITDSREWIRGWVVRVDALRTLRHGWCSTLDVRFQRCGIPFILHVFGMMIWQHTFFSSDKYYYSVCIDWSPLNAGGTPSATTTQAQRSREELICMGFREERHFSGNFRRTFGVPEFRVRAISKESVLVKQSSGNLYNLDRCEPRNYDDCAELGNHVKICKWSGSEFHSWSDYNLVQQGDAATRRSYINGNALQSSRGNRRVRSIEDRQPTWHSKNGEDFIFYKLVD